MFLKDNINSAVEEIWQLALTMASLKYILGTVNEEISQSQASTGPEENDIYEVPQVERKEATPEPSSQETNEEENEIEDDHELDKSYLSSMKTHSVLPIENENNLECSPSLTSHIHLQPELEDNEPTTLTSMIAHQIGTEDEEVPIQTDTDWNFYISHLKDNTIVDNESFFHIESYFYISAVSHQLPAQDPTDGNELHMVSMVAHQHIPTDIEDLDPTSTTSLIAHMEHRKEQKTFKNEEYWNSYEVIELERKMLAELSVENKASLENEEFQNTYEYSNLESKMFPELTMVSHQLTPKDTPAEFDEYLVSTASQKHLTNFLDDVDTLCLPSMNAHQMKPLEVVIEEDVLDISDMLIYDKYISDENLHYENESFCISMVCHQMTIVDTIFEVDEILPSTSTHFILPPYLEDKDTANISTMSAHQLPYDDEVKVCIPEEMDEKYNYFEVAVNNEDEDIQNMKYSMTAHQLLSLEHCDEQGEDLLSMSAHKHFADILEDSDTANISTMLAHQLPCGDESKLLISEEIDGKFNFLKITEQAGDDDIPETKSSMTAHQLLSLENSDEQEDDLLSMLAHKHFADTVEDSDTSCLPSMAVHQMAFKEAFESDKMYDDLSLHYQTIYNSLYKDIEKEFCSSMVCNMLPSLSCCEEPKDYHSSMLSHYHLLDYYENFESSTISSMGSHQFVTEAVLSEEPEILSSFESCPINSEEEAKPHLYHVPMQFQSLPCLIDENEVSENETIVLHSLVIKVRDDFEETTEEATILSQIQLSQSFEEPQEMATSMTAHYEIPVDYEDENTASLHSMVAHQIKSDDIVIVASDYGTEVNEFVVDELNLPSMVSHQLPFSETDDEPSVIVSTLAAHRNVPFEEANLDSGMVSFTMIAHQPVCQLSDGELTILDQGLSWRQSQLIEILNFSPADELYQETSCKKECGPTDTKILQDPWISNKGSQHTEKQQKAVNIPFKKDQEDQSCTKNIKESNIMYEKEKIENNLNKDIINVNSDYSSETGDNQMEDSLLSKLKRVQLLQKMVEEEIGQFDTKKYIKHEIEETSTHATVSNIRGIEFPTIVTVHKEGDLEVETVEEVRKRKESMEKNKTKEDLLKQQTIKHENILKAEQYNEETCHARLMNFNAKAEETGVLGSSQEPLAVATSSTLGEYLTEKVLETKVDEVQKPQMKEYIHNRFIEFEESLESDQFEENPEDNVIAASCTLGDNKPVIIQAMTDSGYESSPDMKNKTDDEKICEKQPLKVIKENIYEPISNNSVNEFNVELEGVRRRSVLTDIKIREKELLESFMSTKKESSDHLRSLQKEEQLKTNKAEVETKVPNKISKKPVIVKNSLEKIKNHTYKIKFHVNIGKETHTHSKHSILQYLFGCFGAQKLFETLPK